MSTILLAVRCHSGDRWPVVCDYTGPDALTVHAESILNFGTAHVFPAVQKLLLPFDSPRNYGQYGRVLGEALFHGPVRETFLKALAGPSPLHVLLFVECPELRSLCWHRLCAPLDGAWRFLALDQRVPFSLYQPSTADRRFPPSAGSICGRWWSSPARPGWRTTG